jgi:trypsin
VRSTILLGVELPIIEYDKCFELIETFKRSPIHVLCAGFLKPGKDACQGDSGGPMVINNKLVGLVSFGVECASTKYPGYYTNVASFVNWIKKYVEI